MNEVFTIIWTKIGLELRRLPSEGRWPDSEPPLATIDVPRPTRTTRFSHPESGGRLDEALSDLFADVEITLPVWFLLPPRWVMQFSIPILDISPSEAAAEHLDWEIQQRLTGELSEFHRIIFPPGHGQKVVEVFVVRKAVLNLVEKAAEAVHLELAGIGVEPSPGDEYSFELPFDLRDAGPIEPEVPAVFTFGKRTVPSWAAVAAVAALTGLTAAWFFIGKPEKGKVSPPTETTVKSSTPVKTADTAEAVVTSAPAGDTTQTIPTRAMTLTESPLRTIISTLPGGSNLEVATITPAGLVAEISGLRNVAEWLVQLKSQPGFKTAELAGEFAMTKSRIAVVRSLGTRPQSQPVSTALFEEKAVAAGMNVRGRRAMGTREQALMLADQIWKAGTKDKLYLARDGATWAVVIQ